LGAIHHQEDRPHEARLLRPGAAGRKGLRRGCLVDLFAEKATDLEWIPAGTTALEIALLALPRCAFLRIAEL
ncbi:MAG TPA: hypothetical protein VGU26_00415, partial [Gaiellaceae bacterium]|nr:hypothetical protein [Gaiellaceae bacterium]